MEDFSQGLKEVSQTCSRLFYLTITIGISDFKKHSVWHAFTIEQYASSYEDRSEEPTCNYHIYQSWVEEASVLRDIQKRKEEGKWILTHDYIINQFMPTLRRILTHNESETLNISTLCESIFGYSPQFKRQQRTWLADTSQTISGYSLKYSLDTINPREVSKRLIDILHE